MAEGGKVTLSGKLRIDEGAIVYLPAPDATLGDDVIVKGWSRAGPPRGCGRRMFRSPSI